MFISTFGAVLLAIFFACLVTTIGIIVIIWREKWGNENIACFISFAAGMLISFSFIQIIPKSIEMNSDAPAFLLVGFMGMYLVNRFVNLVVCHKHDCIDLSIGIIPIIGIGLHSFFDGIIFSVTFNVSVFTGLMTAIGMVLYEFQEGIVTFLLLEKTGFSRKKSAILVFFAAALSTPLGTLISYPFISKVDRSFLGILLLVSAGALVYVGATHLLPIVEKENKKYTLYYRWLPVF